MFFFWLLFMLVKWDHRPLACIYLAFYLFRREVVLKFHFNVWRFLRWPAIPKCKTFNGVNSLENVQSQLKVGKYVPTKNRLAFYENCTSAPDVMWGSAHHIQSLGHKSQRKMIIANKWLSIVPKHTQELKSSIKNPLNAHSIKRNVKKRWKHYVKRIVIVIKIK